MKVAVLTPMKPPDSPVPSGDRTFARAILAALRVAGHTPVLLSRLVTWHADPAALPAIEAMAAAELARLVPPLRLARPDAILTYHSYHKAPDLLGPALAAALRRPYAIVEASRAPKRASGPFARGFALADAALAAADVIGAVTRHDLPALEAHCPGRVVHLPPFADLAPFAAATAARAGGLVVSAAMLREGRKADSVAVLAEAWRIVATARPDARLAIAGDGPARPALEPLFPPGTFLGALDAPSLATLFAGADLFVWPAVDEPFGFTFLEAQAAGLPVVGGQARGVADIVADGESGLLVPPREPAAFASAILALLADEPRRAAMSAAARRLAAQHDLAAGATALTALLARAGEERSRRGA